MKEQIQSILERIKNTAIRSHRQPDSVRLVAVTKTVPVERVLQGIQAGLSCLGENYIQEARDKIESPALKSFKNSLSWHFIGHLQTNKAKYAVRLFDLIHTVDSVKLAEELNKQAKKIDKVQNILIQVDIAGEITKAGAPPGEIESLVRTIQSMENLMLKGFMVIPPFLDDAEDVRPYFKKLRVLSDELQEKFPEMTLSGLSMGMTGDFEVAIQEGATLVRIGTAIFGARH